MNDKYPKRLLVKIKKYFEAERKRLILRIKQLDESDPYKDPDHANDNADIGLDVREEITHQEAKANISQVQKRLAETDEVLDRIEKGTYGFCKKCKKMIDTDRLSTNPLATMCINCIKK